MVAPESVAHIIAGYRFDFSQARKWAQALDPEFLDDPLPAPMISPKGQDLAAMLNALPPRYLEKYVDAIDTFCTRELRHRVNYIWGTNSLGFSDPNAGYGVFTTQVRKAKPNESEGFVNWVFECEEFYDVEMKQRLEEDYGLEGLEWVCMYLEIDRPFGAEEADDV